MIDNQFVHNEIDQNMPVMLPLKQPLYPQAVPSPLGDSNHVFLEKVDLIKLLQVGRQLEIITNVHWNKQAGRHGNVVSASFCLNGVPAVACYMDDPDLECAWVWTREAWKQAISYRNDVETCGFDSV